MIYKRHDLLWLSDAGLDYALENFQDCVPAVTDMELRTLLSSAEIPAIVRRQESKGDDLIFIGFSFPKIIDGTRLRLSSKVPADFVIKHKTPFDVLEYDIDRLPDGEAIKTLVEAGKNYHTQIGLFGSAALQLVTGLPYREEKSDLDIYLRHKGNDQELALFYQRLILIEGQFGLGIDAEIEYMEYGVKIKELFGKGKTVLGKGLYDVVLLEKTKARI
jgi:phosphoribosyl-dephospho-CoA transferase